MRVLYEYKREFISVSDKHEADTADYDSFINEQAQAGWQLVSRAFRATSMSKAGYAILTFKREEDVSCKHQHP